MKINNNFISPNYSERIKNIQYVIIHFTEMSFDGALTRLTDNISEVSAHYLIQNTGEIFRLVEDSKVAWHAGESYWQGQEKLNQTSIGIELDNLGVGAFPPIQIQSCINLCKHLKQLYDIPIINFIGHSDVAPDRKIDPGIFFNWCEFATHGLGIWHDYFPHESKILYKFGDFNKEILTLQSKLNKIGYKIYENSSFDIQTNYVIRAFQSKFYPKIILNKGVEFYKNKDSLYEWDTVSEEILNKLLKKYL